MIGYYYNFTKATPIQLGFDSDAQTFITNANITDTTQKNALNNLVVGLKTDNLWSKLYAAYPKVGGTASSHKYNLKDPRDLDEAYRCIYAGGVTHDSNGVTGNGSNGYANTKFNDSTAGVDVNSFSMGMYCRTDNTGTGYNDMGAVKGSPVSYNHIRVGYSATEDFMGIYDDSNNFGNWFPATTGLFCVSRNSSTEQKVYRNGSLIATRSGFSATSLTNLEFYLMARNFDGSPAIYSNRNYSWFHFATKMNDTEMSNLNTHITTFQTAIGRNV